MIFKSQAAKDRAERKAYRAMDAMQDLVDRQIVGYEADKAMQYIRNVINKIGEIPIREGKAAKP